MILRSRSLIGGIGLVFAMAFVLAACVAVGLISFTHRAEVSEIEMAGLESQADTIARSLRKEPDGEFRLELPPDLAAAYSTLYGRYAYSVIDFQKRKLLFNNLPTTRWLTRVNSTDVREIIPFDGFEVGRQLFSGISKRFMIDGAPFLIQIGQDRKHPDVVTDDLAANFLTKVAWVLLPVFLLLGLAVMATLRMHLRPLNAVSERVRNIDGRMPAERLPEAGIPSEILPLVHAANEALARVEEASALQRDFIANAAHELRTPLAVLQAHADLLEDRRAAAALTTDIGILERLVAQLLSIAQVDALSGPPPRQSDLISLTHEVVRYLGPLARRRGARIAFKAPPGTIPVMTWDEVLTQAFVNLVENAIGHSPEGSTVTVEVMRPATVTISDQGPGVPAHERDVIFHRFWRKSRGESSKKHGAGLGLAIVRRAAELHGARVSVHEAPGGGAMFRFQLEPLPEPADETPAGEPLAA